MVHQAARRKYAVAYKEWTFMEEQASHPGATSKKRTRLAVRSGGLQGELSYRTGQGPVMHRRVRRSMRL